VLTGAGDWLRPFHSELIFQLGKSVLVVKEALHKDFGGHGSYRHIAEGFLVFGS